MKKREITIIIALALFIGITGFTAFSLLLPKEPTAVADSEKKILSDMSHEELKIFFGEKGVNIPEEFFDLSLSVKTFEEDPNHPIVMGSSRISNAFEEIRAVVNDYYELKSYIDEYGHTIWYK